MSFISDLLIEISSFRIRIGNKLNALKTLIDGKAEIDGSNIPAGTFWNTLKAGGVGNYVYVDVQENDFTRVMVWENGGWFWTNKDGFSSWLGLDALKADLENFGGRNYAPGTRAEFETRVFSGWSSTIAEVAVKEAETYTARVYIKANPNNDRNIGIRIFWYDINNNSTESTTSNTILPGAEGYAIKTATAPFGTVYCRVFLRAHTSGGVNNSVEFKEFKLEKGTIPTDWTPAPEDHVSDWNETDNTKFSFIKNKPTLVNNYVDSIIHTNGTTAGTVYTFKRVGLSDLTLQLTPASALFSGVVTIGDQTFEGIKAFLKSPKVPNATNSDEAVNKSQMDAGDLPGQTAFGWGDFRKEEDWDIVTVGFNYSTVNAPVSFAEGISTLTGRFQMGGRYDRFFARDRRQGTGWKELWHDGNFNPAQYVLQSSLNTQLANYATLAGTQTFTGQNTFTTAIYIPAATLNGHAVNLGQLNDILDDYATEAWVTQQIANISIPNGQLTVNTTSDLVGGFVYLPNGNVTTTIGLSTAILNNIADGVTAYSWGNHANAGYTNLGAVQSWVNSQNFATAASIGNGTVIVQGVGNLTGVVTFQLNQSGNAIGSFDLTPATKNDIQKGVDAYGYGDHAQAGYQNSTQVNSAINSAIQPFIQSINRVFRPSPAPFNLSITTKKTVVTYGNNVSGAVLNISNGSVDGDELAINGSGEWGVVVNGNLIDRHNNVGSTSLNTSALFWWHNSSNRWIQAI